MRHTTGAALLASMLLAVAGGAAAQDSASAGVSRAPPRPPRLTVTLPNDPGSGSPVVRATGVFGDGVFAGALRDGFPVRLQYRLELWRSSTLFDRLEREQAWLALAQYDPLNGRYTLTRTGGGVETFTSLEALAQAIAVAYTVDLPQPEGRGRARYYYVATLDIESLSLSELEEVERWLRGDLGRALTHEGDVGGALGRGARRLLVRFSGLPSRRLEARTPLFANR